eukprot:scaffold973_cov399-Prasinococcus_capsulatus_cf.AAC.30
MDSRSVVLIDGRPKEFHENEASRVPRPRSPKAAMLVGWPLVVSGGRAANVKLDFGAEGGPEANQFFWLKDTFRR